MRQHHHTAPHHTEGFPLPMGESAAKAGQLSDVLFRSAASTAQHSRMSGAMGGGGGGTAKPTGRPLVKHALSVHNEETAYEVIKNNSFTCISSAVMKDMPELVQEEVKRYAAVKLSMLWLPRVMLSSKQKQRKVAAAPEDDDKLTKIIAVLKSGELISCWPEDRLQCLAEGAVPVATQKGDRIITEGESCRSGLWLILSGKGFMTKKQKATGKGPAQEVVVHRFVAPVLIGDFALLTDEPRTANVILDTECSCFVLQRTFFLKELGLLTQRQQEEIYHKAFQRRQRNIANFFPRGINDIKASYLLSDIPDSDAETLLQSLQPLCIRQGLTIVKKGAPSRYIHYLCRGKAESIDSCGGELVHTPTQLATLGEMSYIFDHSKHESSVLAVQHCDLWVLPFTAINEHLKNPSFRQRVYTKAESLRLAHLRRLQLLPDHIESCVTMMERTAILGQICSRSFLKEVAQRLEPQVFLPRQTIVSAVEQCNKLCVITTGTAVVLNKQSHPTLLRSGDVIGTSLLAVHRWLFPVQAHVGCDVWTLPKAALVEMLQAHGYYEVFHAVVKRELTEFQFMPLARMLGRRRTPCGRFVIPPLLHPCQGLPSGIVAPFHFEPLPGLKQTPASPKNAAPGLQHDEGDAEDSGAKEDRESSSCLAERPGRSESKKLWMVLKPSLPRNEKPGKDFFEWAPNPPPPRAKRELKDSDDLMAALDSIAPPTRYRRPIHKGNA